ncbi:hypothetical protein L6R53_13030, partial [Myxococcota bacterium]|nr:hypothetical protein [Myxococcota bacterium]
RPRPRPVGLLALGGVGLGGLLLAGAWEPAVARPFALLLLALAATHLVATGAALALVERPLAGRLLGLGSALAALATGVLGLHLGGLWGWVGG